MKRAPQSKKRGNRPLPLKVSNAGEPYYRVEALRGRREHFGEVEYEVKWEGYGEHENTWELRENLLEDGLARLIAEYEEGRVRVFKKEAKKPFRQPNPVVKPIKHSWNQSQRKERVEERKRVEEGRERRVKLRVVRKNELEKMERIRVESLIRLEDLTALEKEVLRLKGVKTAGVGVLYVVSMERRTGGKKERGLVTAEALLRREPRRFLKMHEAVLLRGLRRSKVLR